MLATVNRAGQVRLLPQTTATTVDDTGEGGGEHEGVEAPSPIVPATNELIWGGLAFVVLFVAMVRFGFPAVQRTIDARAQRIRDDLDEAAKARADAETILSDYQRQLADAKGEANRIIEEARQTADQLRRDLMARAEAEVSELRQRNREEIDAAKARTMAELRSEVTGLAIDLAEKVVAQNLDRQANTALVERFIAEVEAGAAR